MIEMNNLGDQLNFEVRDGKVINADYSSEICDVEVDGEIYMGVPIDMKLLPDDSPIHSKIHGDLEFSARVHIKNNINKTVLVAFGTPLNEYPKVIGFKDYVPVFYMAVYNTNNSETCFTANRISSLSGNTEQPIGDSISYKRHIGVGSIFSDDLSFTESPEDTIEESSIGWGDENDEALITIDKIYEAPIVNNLFYTDNENYTSTQTFYPELDETADGYLYGYSYSGDYNTYYPDGTYIYKDDIIPVNNYVYKEEVIASIELMDAWQKRSLCYALGASSSFFRLFFSVKTFNHVLYDTLDAVYSHGLDLDFDYETALWTMLPYYEPEKMYEILTKTRQERTNSSKPSTYGIMGTNSFVRETGASIVKKTSQDLLGNVYEKFTVTGRYPFFRWDLVYSQSAGKYIFTNSWAGENSPRNFGRWVHEYKTSATGYDVVQRDDEVYQPFAYPWVGGEVSNTTTYTHSGFGNLSSAYPNSYLKFGNMPYFVSSGTHYPSEYSPPDGSKITFIRPDGTVADESVVGSYSQDLILMAPLKSKY